MTTFINTIGKKAFTALCVGILFFLFVIAQFAFATEPTPQERAAAELPAVLREIEKTQEYADRNAAAKTRRQQLIDCIDNGKCEGF